MLTTNIIVFTMIFVIMLSFFYISINYVSGNAIQTKLELVAKNMNECLVEIQEDSDLIMDILYRNYNQVSDLVDIISYTPAEYTRLSVNDYLSTSFFNSNTTGDVWRFASQSFGMSKNLSSIVLTGNQTNDRSITITRDGDIYVTYSRREIRDEVSPNVIIEHDSLNIVKPIVNQSTRQQVGEFTLVYDLTFFDDEFNSYKETNDLQGYNFMITDIEDNTLYSSTETPLVQEQHPLINSDLLGKDRYEKVIYNSYGLISIVQAEKEIVDQQTQQIIWWINFGAVILLVVYVLIMYYKFRNLDIRLFNIMSQMDRISRGEFDVDIEDTIGDELSLIANHFNVISGDFKTYVEKTYLLELEQKKAEIKMLENQINPHFLYNTLESIRMKALANKDREVAKMIYALATLFRALVKENPKIQIGKELGYCKKYLEIFEYRYENQFVFDIQFDSETLKYEILKFTMQPLIENYFVHGIRIGEPDNKIVIEIVETDIINIIITDNGRGMSEQDIDLLNDRLQNYDDEYNSIGIVNVHRRIKMNYGKEYGLRYEMNQDRGIKVVITIPKIVEESNV